MPIQLVTAQSRNVIAVEIPVGAGARDDRCKNGPERFRRRCDDVLRSQGINLAWQHMPVGISSAGIEPLDIIGNAAVWTAGITRRLSASGARFTAIGGDHSCAIGTWSGVADAKREAGPLGLIWIDAHMDMHVPETTHSGRINGMPLAVLLGHGARNLTNVAETGPALAPQHLCLVGARSFEPEEVVFAQRHGVRVIGMAEVRRRGIDAALADALDIATTGTAGYGVSLDLDAFDPVDAPGVGTPEPGGIRPADFFETWSKLVRDADCLGIEIAEYNPSCDHDGCTARLMGELISASV